jgi:hypothetical protein
MSLPQRDANEDNMARNRKKQTGSRTRGQKTEVGSLAWGFHEGGRSEYLAKFVFSAFGTAIPVQREADTGLDMHCTILERDGKRAWPRAHYSVQVKSNMKPWILSSPKSVRWIIEHPLPIFLCVVKKRDAQILVYHTSPRFAAWAAPTLPDRLKLELGSDTEADSVSWTGNGTFQVKAPILDFTIGQILDPHFRSTAQKVLEFWIDHDVENLHRIRSGVNWFWAPTHYKKIRRR